MNARTGMKGGREVTQAGSPFKHTGVLLSAGSFLGSGTIGVGLLVVLVTGADRAPHVPHPALPWGRMGEMSWPYGMINAGIWILMATPVLAVGAAAIAFYLQRNITYCIMGSAVLLILAVSVSLLFR